VRLATALGGQHVAAVYGSQKTVSGLPALRLDLRVVDLAGSEVVAPRELNPMTPGVLGTKFDVAWDGAGFDVFWADLELQPAVQKKLYWMRIDPATGMVRGPVEVATEMENPGNQDGNIQDLQELAIACNDARCLLAYRQEVYSALVQLSAAKVFVASVDLASGTVTRGAPVLPGDWDIQEDPQLAVAADGSFLLAFAGTDTAAVLNTPDPCDMSGRQKIYLSRFDRMGNAVGAPATLMDDVGQRYQAGVAAHPDGAAVLWEDEREHCTESPTATNRLAVDFAHGGTLERPYTPVPSSRLVAESAIHAWPLGPNYVFVWADERLGGSILDSRAEVRLDTYWR